VATKKTTNTKNQKYSFKTTKNTAKNVFFLNISRGDCWTVRFQSDIQMICLVMVWVQM